jgi:phosphatidate phosphatase APP1
MARPHFAAIVEDAFHHQCSAWLRRRGWRPRSISHTGYGSPEFARVLGRVVLSHPDRRSRRPPEGGQRGWRAFLTAPAMNVPVVVTLGAHETSTRSDRSGYVDVTLPVSALEPGWHEATLAAEGAAPVLAPVRIVDPSARMGLVSDIDDTVITTSLPRPLIAAWNTFVRHETARHVVPGMAALYRELLADEQGAPIFYLSTGAWNTAETLTRFLRRHGYPPGPLLLTDWGPTNSGWFRSGQQHKRTTLRRLAREFPHLRWILVGDDGQHDPAIYGDFARERPDVIEAVAIRELTPTEQVLSHGLPVSFDELPPRARRRERVFRAPDGYGLRRLLRARHK